jgi:hypothetical protein
MENDYPWLGNEYIGFFLIWIIPILCLSIAPIIFLAFKKVEHKAKFILAVLFAFIITILLLDFVSYPFVFFGSKFVYPLVNNGVDTLQPFFYMVQFFDEWVELMFYLPAYVSLPWLVYNKYEYFQSTKLSDKS